MGKKLTPSEYRHYDFTPPYEIHEGEDWWIGAVCCAICGNVQQCCIAIPKESEEPFVSIECMECGNMACSPAD